MIIRILLATACLIYIAIAATLYATQRSFLFVPDTHRPSAAETGIPNLQAVALPSPYGNLLAWYLPPRPDGPVLAYFHGNGGNLADRTDRLRRFAAAGWGVLLPEYPGYGGNPGHPSEAAFTATAEAAMAFLDHQAIPHVRTAIYGESIGTAVATRTAAGRTLAGLVLESPFTSITAIAQRRFPYIPVAWLLRDPFNQLRPIARLRCPLLVLQGARDTIVPPDLGQKLFAAAPQPKQFWSAPNGTHTNLWSLGADTETLAFLDKTVAAAAPR